jgi:hypothetical protein
VHARLAKRVAEKAARKLEQQSEKQVVTWLCLCRMSFGGHQALNASNEVQKKLQVEDIGNGCSAPS